jgi:hypothetical protein
MTADAQRPAMHNLALGIDVGTSGVRAAAVDETGLRVAFAAVKMTGHRHCCVCAANAPEAWIIGDSPAGNWRPGARGEAS